MSLASIAERLSTLVEITRSLTSLIQRLSHLQPASSSPAVALEARQDLTSEIHDTLKQADEDLETLQQDIADITSLSAHKRNGGRTQSEREREVEELAAGSVRVEEELKVLRARSRKAQLMAKRNFEVAERRERAAYLASLQAAAANSGSAQDEKAPDNSRTHAQMSASLFANRRHPAKSANTTQEDQLLTATNDVTSSLRRTHALLTSELSRSRFAQETLETSNAALQELNERYMSLDDLLGKSKGLVNTLLRSQKSDTWYLETTLKILIATVAWLVFRRLFYGPMWWFFYLPIKLLYRMTTAILGGALTLVGGSQGAAKTQVGLSATSSLKVMPSATGKPPTIPARSRGQAANIAVGAGGAGAKGASVPQEAAESLSEYLGNVAQGTNTTSVYEVQATPGPEQDNQQGEERTNDQKDGDKKQAEQQERRADGEALRERDEATEPRNPKKRMWEEPAADQQQPRDEL